MATQWVLGKISDALSPAVSSACAGAGTFAGGAMNTVGNGISGVGESLNTNIRYYGDGAKDYGNAIMDWSKSPATRAQTASNPLGLSTSTAGGKNKVTTPSVYRAPPAPKKAASKLPTTAMKKDSTARTKMADTVRTTGSVKSSKPKASVTGKPPTKSAVKPKTMAKPSTAAATKTRPSGNNKVASNPLGLKY